MYINKKKLKQFANLKINIGSSNKLWYDAPNFNALIKFDDDEYACSFSDVLYTELAQILGFSCMESSFCKTEISYDKIYYKLKCTSSPSFARNFRTYKKYCIGNPDKNHFTQLEGSISVNFNPNGYKMVNYREVFEKVNYFPQFGFMQYRNVNEASIVNVSDYVESYEKYIDFMQSENKPLICEDSNIEIELYKRALIDYLLFQGDRLPWNIGFIYNKQTGEFTLAPSFDNSYSLIFCQIYKNTKKTFNNIAKIFKNKTTKFKRIPKKQQNFFLEDNTWFDYEFKDDMKTLNIIYKTCQKYPEFHTFVKNLIKLDFNKLLIYINNMAIIEGITPLTTDKFNMICTILKYKQQVLKNLLIYQEKKKKGSSPKTLFNFNEKTLKELGK